VAYATNASEVRIGSMPYVGGRAALVVLYIGDPRGYEYYLWNGSQFEARPDHSIYAANMNQVRAFTHNVVADTVMHLVFGLGNELHHCWKNYGGGEGVWHQAIIDSSPYTVDNDWLPISTVRGQDMYIFYCKKTSTDAASSQIYYKKWSQGGQSWTAPQLVSTTPGVVGNRDPNTCYRVPASSNYIPVFWNSATGGYGIYFNRIILSAPPADTIPPAAVRDLGAVVGSEPGSIELTWTAPGDDSVSGTADHYVIKYSLAQLDEAGWALADSVANAPAPLPAGTGQSFLVGGLSGGWQYYLGLKAYDEVGNASGLSNSPSDFARGIRPPFPLGEVIDTLGLAATLSARVYASYLPTFCEFALDTSGSFPGPEIRVDYPPDTLAQATFDSLAPNTAYYWHCRTLASNYTDSSNWSITSLFDFPTTGPDTIPPGAILDLRGSEGR